MTRYTAFTAASAICIACAPATQSEEQQANVEAGEAQEQVAIAADDVLTCDYPVRASDTGADLVERFGDAAEEITIYGAEVFESPGTALWGDQPGRRLEVAFDDAARTTVVSVVARENSDWQVGGVAVGDTMTQVNAANGDAFTLLGFEWDYSGMVTGFGEGALANLGQCDVLMTLSPSMEWDTPLALLGSNEFSSDDPRMAADQITVFEIGIAFPFEE